MEILFMLPMIVWIGFAFVLGTGVGSFLNVLIARLPFEKSIIWPGSRCGHCLRPLRTWDNLPLLGYLRLRGMCRFCGITFSSRYLWVELGTGLMFAGLFVLETLLNFHHLPGLANANAELKLGSPSVESMSVFLFHATLSSLLLAAAIIDAEYRIIPAQITYTGTLLGLIGSTLFPWPWPTTDPALLAKIPTSEWFDFRTIGLIPMGSTPWPFWGPLPDWASAGSWQLGLLTGLAGAAVGMALVRMFKFLFEVGFGQEALGLGDADLMMMVGAFLGWQVVVPAFFLGAIVALVVKIPMMIVSMVRGKGAGRDLPFGPGLVGGTVLTWLCWPWLAPRLQVLFDPMMVLISIVIVGGGLLLSGLILRR